MTRLRNVFLAVSLCWALVASPSRAEAPASNAQPSAEPPAAASAAAPSAEATAPTTAAAAAPAAPAATGMLSVSSTPVGQVFLDGADTGLVTPVVDFPVAAGTHTVRVVTSDGRETSQQFTMEAGGALNLALNLPEAPTAQPGAPSAPATPEVPTPPPAETTPAAPSWSWMTVTGWTGLGLGTIGLLSGSVVLTTPTDPDQGPLGFGLFGAGVGLVLGGGVMLYLDNEMNESAPAAPAAQ